MLYASIGELDELKAMADEYMWEEMRGYLEPPPAATATTGSAYAAGPTGEGGGGRSLHAALEYSMDVLRTTAAPSIRSSSGGGVGRPRGGGGGGGGEYVGELPGLIGFDWGSCAWRHCGARADAQEAVAELYSNVGMLEPFECRFIIGKHHRRVNVLVCGGCKMCILSERTTLRRLPRSNLFAVSPSMRTIRRCCREVHSGCSSCCARRSQTTPRWDSGAVKAI